MTKIMIRSYGPNFGTHIPVLIRVLQISQGPVLELGMGVFSTPLLHILCAKYNRLLISFESNQYYFERHREFKTDMHRIDFIENWDSAEIEDRKWGVAFIDHDPTTHRHIEAGRLAGIAKFVVIHDSEPGRRCRYQEIYKLFKYRFDYKQFTPWTTILSNFINLVNFKV